MGLLKWYFNRRLITLTMITLSYFRCTVSGLYLDKEEDNARANETQKRFKNVVPKVSKYFGAFLLEVRPWMTSRNDVIDWRPLIQNFRENKNKNNYVFHFSVNKDWIEDSKTSLKSIINIVCLNLFTSTWWLLDEFSLTSWGTREWILDLLYNKVSCK